MKKLSKNNKGFSLVELIVVILIMAVIAVALAPQVMKWVNNSKIATDVSNYDSLVANIQLALADKDAYDAAKAATYTFSYDASGMDVTLGTGATPTALVTDGTEQTAGGSDKLIIAMNALDKSWEKLKAKVSSGSYKIIVTNGVVERNTAPDGTTVQ